MGGLIKLSIYINLRKLNSLMVKDAYSIRRIQDTLDCLTRCSLVYPFGLKSRYWQVELERTSKALRAFTLDPLGFFECDQTPFGLTNVLVAFQCLMETCLGQLPFWWYHLSRCYHCLCSYYKGAFGEVLHNAFMTTIDQTEVATC